MSETKPRERLSQEVLDGVLEWLLAAYPDAPIAALTPDGMSTEIPDGIEVGAHGVAAPGGSGMQYVPADELDTVLAAWQRAREVGASRALLGPEDDPDTSATVYLVDATHRHGVYFGMTVVPDAVLAEGPATEPVVREPTKLGRMHKDEIATIVDVDDATVELLGYEPEEIVGHRSLELIHPDDHARAVDSWMALLADPGGVRTVRYRHRRKDGSYVWCDVSQRNLLRAEEGCVITDLVDVSAEMIAQEALRERERLLARLTEELPLGVLQIDAERDVVLANRRFYEIVGTEPGVDFDEALVTMPPDDRVLLDEALDRVLGEGIDENVRLRVKHPKDSEHRLLQVGLRALTAEDGHVTGAVNWVEDVTESVLLAIELETRATHDALTGCFNRASTMAVLEEVLESDLHARRGTAILFVDVDQFKAVNDELGHAAGDEVLRAVAKRTGSVIRERDMLGRLGGDEFLVVCPGMSYESDAMRIAKRMSEVVNQPVAWGTRRIDLQVSIGVVWCDVQRLDADWLVAQADRVMYESKRDGAGRPVGKPVGGRRAS